MGGTRRTKWPFITKLVTQFVIQSGCWMTSRHFECLSCTPQDVSARKWFLKIGWSQRDESPCEYDVMHNFPIDPRCQQWRKQGLSHNLLSLLRKQECQRLQYASYAYAKDNHPERRLCVTMIVVYVYALTLLGQLEQMLSQHLSEFLAQVGVPDPNCLSPLPPAMSMLGRVGCAQSHTRGLKNRLTTLQEKSYWNEELKTSLFSSGWTVT